MERHRRNYDTMWNEASEEVKSVYGKQYLEDWYKKQLAYSQNASHDVTSVIDAMEDAILASQPRFRYLIDGGDGMLDLYCVSKDVT